jgi:hypothetical protein
MGGDNPTSAENQQERLITGDQNPQRPYARRPKRSDEEMVPAAWRHAGVMLWYHSPSKCDNDWVREERNSLSGKWKNEPVPAYIGEARTADVRPREGDTEGSRLDV